MLKSISTVFLLTASMVASVVQASDSTVKSEDFKTAPTPLDMMQLMSTYLGGDVSLQQLLDMGVKTNMRIPMQHLRVRISDTRTNTDMTRDEIAHLLGQSRQDSSHDLIFRTLSAFPIPGITADQMIDLFDASALASMQTLPGYIDIEFYDARLGANQPGKGDVSGSVPNKIYTPKTAAEPLKESEPEWDDLAVMDYFVANEQFFKPKNDFEFVLPYFAVAADLGDLNRVTHEEFELFLKHEPTLDVGFVNKNTPFFYAKHHWHPR